MSAPLPWCSASRASRQRQRRRTTGAAGPGPPVPVCVACWWWRWRFGCGRGDESRTRARTWRLGPTAAMRSPSTSTSALNWRSWFTTVPPCSSGGCGGHITRPPAGSHRSPRPFAEQPAEALGQGAIAALPHACVNLIVWLHTLMSKAPSATREKAKPHNRTTVARATRNAISLPHDCSGGAPALPKFELRQQLGLERRSWLQVLSSVLRWCTAEKTLAARLEERSGCIAPRDGCTCVCAWPGSHGAPAPCIPPWQVENHYHAFSLRFRPAVLGGGPGARPRTR